MGILYLTRVPKFAVEIPIANAKVKLKTSEDATIGFSVEILIMFLIFTFNKTDKVRNKKKVLSIADKNITIFLDSHK